LAASALTEPFSVGTAAVCMKAARWLETADVCVDVLVRLRLRPPTTLADGTSEGSGLGERWGHVP
jgi:hypothetical protein